MNIAFQRNLSNTSYNPLEPTTEFHRVMRMTWWIAGSIASLLLVGTVSLWLGKDANWDLQNYHLYNGYNYWFDRLDIDHHPAGIQTFNNPILDIATYPLLTAIPDWLGGFLLGAFQGFNLLLILAIAREVFGHSRRDLFLSLLCVVTAMTGAVTWSEIGTTFGDLTTAIPVLAAIYLVLRSLRHLRDFSSQIVTIYCLAAGLVVGIATGLKFTNAIFTLALIASLVFVIPRHKLFIIVVTGIIAGIGFLLVNGWWALELFERFSNPLFPYFNAWFGSPYYPLINFKDPRFFPANWVQAIFYPFYFSWNYQTAELPFKDFRFPVAFLCLISLLATKLGLLATKLTATADNPVKASATIPKLQQERFLIAFLVIAYVLWLKLFSIQRYAIVIEMLIPLLCIIVIERILPYRLQFPTAITVLSILIATTEPMNWGRVSWSGHRYITCWNLTEPLHDSVVYLGRPPLAYVAATLTSPDLIWISHPFNERDHEALIKKINNKRIILLTRTTPENIDDAKINLGLLGLNVADTCSSFYTNLGGPFLLCPLLHKGNLDPMVLPEDTSEWQFEIMPELREIALRSDESTWLSVSLRNSGHSKFLANLSETLTLMGHSSIGKLDGEMNISYHIFDSKNTLLLWDGLRTRIPKSLSSGESVVFRVRIVAPHEKGLYRIRFDVVQEGVTWFSNRTHTEDLILNVY